MKKTPYPPVLPSVSQNSLIVQRIRTINEFYKSKSIEFVEFYNHCLGGGGGGGGGVHDGLVMTMTGDLTSKMTGEIF